MKNRHIKKGKGIKVEVIGESHQAVFTEALAECHQVFDENILIVCEKFKVISK